MPPNGTWSSRKFDEPLTTSPPTWSSRQAVMMRPMSRVNRPACRPNRLALHVSMTSSKVP